MRHLLSQSAIDPELPTHLPDSTESLLHLFENGPSHKERICALAKIKHQMLSSLDGLVLAPVDKSTAKAVESLFCRALLRYIRKNHENSEENEVETRLFFHTVSLTIKHFFSEEGFKHLLAQVTDLIDNSSLRVKLALHFFTEIINTVEDNRGLQGPRCHFQRHLTSEHISSMLTLANFCLEKGLLAENTSLEEGQIQEAFELVAPEDTITAALKLVRACLCFDWLGEKYNEFSEVWQMGSLVIPTKRARQVTQTQFDKWLRNCEWIRLYSFLFKAVRSMELKIEVAGLLGDMSRIHMKFFKNKNNYRVYIQNIVYAFSQILQTLQISKNSQESIQIALALLSNLNKLLGGSASSLLFDINENFFKGLLQNIKNFIVYQLIAEQTLNSNLLFYSFGFLEGVMKRTRFQTNKTYFDTVEDILRDICRNYEQYLRILMNSMRKNPIRISEAVQYRMDYAHLRDSLSYYDWTEIQLFLLPFRLMKPRYATTNTIYEVFIFICARVARAVSLLELFRMQKWEKEVAYSMVSQSVVKVGERFGFTSFKKISNKQKEEWEESQLCPLLPPISEHYEEEIDNEEEYCHMLRLSVFVIIDQVLDMSLESTLPLSATMIKLTSLTVELCLTADLQEKGSRQWGERASRQKILEAFQRLPLLCRKAYLREYERSLYLLQQTHRFLKLQPIKSRYSYAQSDLEFVDMQLQYEASYLLQTLVKLIPQEDFNSTIVELRLLTVICLEAHWHSIPESLLTSIDICIQCVQIIMSVDPVASLVHYKQKRITDFLRKILSFLDSFEGKEAHLTSIVKLLRKLIETKCEDVREEALNKTFVILRCLLPFLRETPELPNGLLQELSLMSCEVLPKTRQKDLELLGLELREFIISRKEPERMELETTCLSITHNQSVQNLPSFNQSEEGSFEALLQKQLPKPLQTQSVPAAEVTGGEGHTEQASSSSVGIDIYDGYHREKTMSVLSKYMKQHQQELQNPSGVGQTEDPSAQDFLNKSPFKTSLQQLYQDSQFPEQPMEIEHSHPHDYTDIINEIVHGEHHSCSASNAETGGNLDGDHQPLEQDIYIPLQPTSLETEEQEVREDAENEVETQFLTIPEEGESTFSSEHAKPKEIPSAAQVVIEEPRDSETASTEPKVPEEVVKVAEVVADCGSQAMDSPKGVPQSKSSGELDQSEGKRSLMLLSSSSSESETKGREE